MTYAEFLKARGVPVFTGSGTEWHLYQRALIPVSPLPSFIRMPRKDALGLLRRSGAWMVRWSGAPVDTPGPWWWMVCSAYDRAALTGKMRNQVRRGWRSRTNSLSRWQARCR